MNTFLWVLVGLNQVFILLIGSVDLSKYALTDFALKEHLSTLTAEQARLFKRLHKSLQYVKALQQLELIIAGVVLIGLLSQLLNPLLGIIYGLISFLVLKAVSRIIIVRVYAEKLFISSLDTILSVAQKLRPLWAVTGVSRSSTTVLPTSQAEFVDQLRRLPSTVLSPLQRQRLENLLSAEDKTVSSIMTPKRRVVTVDPSATLGPVLLTDLQKSQHGYFPVVPKKGQPEGVLSLGDVADIHVAKQRTSVKDLMSNQIEWVAESASLLELLDAFLHKKRYLLLVKSAEDEFAGVVTIADLAKHLIGIVKD